MKTRCLIALGANQGNCQEALQAALERLDSQSHSQLLCSSSFYRTAPVGGPAGQDEFINAAALIETELAVQETLQWLLEIERSLGRERTQRWGARKLDLDILLFGQHVVNRPGIEVPHPRMSYRRFVLEPAAEVAAEMNHPLIGWSMQRLLQHLNNTPLWLAFAGHEKASRELATAWTKKLSKKLEAICLLKEQTSDPVAALDKHRAHRQGIVSDFVPPTETLTDAPRLIVHFPISRGLAAESTGGAEAVIEPPQATPTSPYLQLPVDESKWDMEITAAFEAMR